MDKVEGVKKSRTRFYEVRFFYKDPETSSG